MPPLEQLTIMAAAAVVIVGFVSHFASRIGVAAPLALVVVGIALAVIPGTPEIELEPELILTVVLPPLLYAAALQVPFVELRRNLRVIGFLSVVLVVVSAAVAGLVVHALLGGVGLALAIALGAVVSPPDAVAAISLGKRLGLPPRIVTILEGEGLVNDATALVLLSTALSIATADQGLALDGWDVVRDFAWAVAGALVLGWLAGTAAVRLRARVRDSVLDTAVSLVVPFVAFLAAEQIAASGVVAVVVAGIVVGNGGAYRIRAAHRRAEGVNWRTFTMLVENGVFLLMGYLLPPVVLHVAQGQESLGLVLGVGLVLTLVLIALRLAVMPLLLWSIRARAGTLARRQSVAVDRMAAADERFGAVDDARIRSRLDRFRGIVDRNQHDVTAERDGALGWRDGVVLGMAGMRGVVTIAAAQTLPGDHPLYESLVLIAFVVAIATLLPQGLLLPVVVRRLRLARDVDVSERAQLARLAGRLQEVGAAAIEEAADGSELDRRAAATLRRRIDERAADAAAMAGGGDDEARIALLRRIGELQRAEIDAERAALDVERRRGEFSSEAIAAVLQALDDQEIRLERMQGD
ncbi:cation:proton antiporter [Agrococcus sp. SL85]|uniref:cation:proton antiporter n=1 Tax=Agrococcus sp. SL85 TaxID=2995141 RepID=UPI00226C6DA8|nr:cation:proton antiporter [Agrococcus sp. SL85]WAC67320.1 cation:proton antiporter [Agrococcus sp. SL85]